MLVLSRKVGERFLIGDNIVVVVTRVAGNRVTFGVIAPKSLRILREELVGTPPSPRKQQAQPRPRKPFIGRRPSAA